LQAIKTSEYLAVLQLSNIEVQPNPFPKSPENLELIILLKEADKKLVKISVSECN